MGIVVSAVLGANLARRAAEQLGTQLRSGPFPNLDPAWTPAVVGVVVGAVVVGLVGLIGLGRAGGAGGGIAGLVLGAIAWRLRRLGLGWADVQLARRGRHRDRDRAGHLVALMPVLLLRAHVDPTARFRRLWPKESYDTAMETKDWLESEWARRRARLGRT